MLPAWRVTHHAAVIGTGRQSFSSHNWRPTSGTRSDAPSAGQLRDGSVLGALAERFFFDDAPSVLIKLRQLSEFLAKEVAARHGLLPASTASFDEVLRTLKVRSVLPREIADLFFHLKRVGNAAVHENIGTKADALKGGHSDNHRPV